VIDIFSSLNENVGDFRLEVELGGDAPHQSHSSAEIWIIHGDFSIFGEVANRGHVEVVRGWVDDNELEDVIV
jgi:hypothetical protein